MTKDIGGGVVVRWWVCGLLDYSVSPSPSPFPLDFEFWIWDLDLGLGFGTGLGLDNYYCHCQFPTIKKQGNSSEEQRDENLNHKSPAANGN